MKDLIKREDAIGAIEGTDWYHQNRNKDMVSGANSDEHQAWYKAEDVYKALKEVPSAEITRDAVMQYCKSRLLVLATVEFIKHQYRIGFEDGKASALGCHYLSRGKEQTMSRWICIDDICIPSDENDWEELVAFADAIAEQEPINIVRCKECKHRESCCRPCYKSADSYCSDGERKESE